MSARDLDFEEVSLMRERSSMLKDGYKSYLQSHPELTQLLGDLVNSCLIHRPEDVFDHAASHFGGKRVSTDDGEIEPLAAEEDGAQADAHPDADDAAAAAAAADDEAPAADAAGAAPRIIISGAPASGKGTQCERLVAKYGIKHISTGDLLRAAVVAETDLGKSAKGYMEKGELVPDELLIPLVAEGLADVSEGWLLDGFPRTQGQAQALKDAGIIPDVLLVLDVPDEELTGRCVDRRLDPVSGKIYHLKTSPPENDEVAARLVQRADDTAEKIQTRLKLYHENKDAVCSVFADQVRHVDGNRDADAVNADICRVVDTGADAEMDASAAKIQATFRGKQARKKMPKPAPRLFSSELDKWAAFNVALSKEAEDGGYELSVLMSHVFSSFDANKNGMCCINRSATRETCSPLAWLVCFPQAHWSATSGSFSSTTSGRRID